MTRSGSGLMLALAIFAALGLVAASEASAYVRRLHGLQARAVRLQAEELAQAAQALPEGSVVSVGVWQVSRLGALCVAAGPGGSATCSGASLRFQRSRP